jgi:hypothetical protein
MRTTGDQRDVAASLGEAATHDGADRPRAEHHVSHRRS